MSIEYGPDGLPSGISTPINQNILRSTLPQPSSQIPAATDWLLIERKMSLLEQQLTEALDTVQKCKRFAHSKLEES